MSNRFLKIRWRYLLSPLILFSVTMVAVYLAFPEFILQAIVASARHSAGLSRRSVDVEGHHFVFLDGGAGIPVVLLHGFGMNKDLWNGVAAHLTPHYRVIAPDLPGFGESPVSAGEKYDAESQAKRLRAFLDALGVSEHHIGGSSMGGLIAAMYAAKYPDNVRSLMIGAAPGVLSPQKSELARHLEAGENPLLVHNEAEFDRLLKLAFFRPPSILGPFKRVMLKDAVKQQAKYAQIFDDLNLIQPGKGILEPLLPNITKRALIAWGAHDQIVDPSSIDVFSAAIPNDEITIFEDCGHALPRECPALLAQRYLLFLSSVSTGGAPNKSLQPTASGGG